MAFSKVSEKVVIGVIHGNVQRKSKEYAPLAGFLSDNLKNEGIVAVDTLVLPDSIAMIEAIQKGQVDLVFDSPLVVARIAKQSGAHPVLRRWKEGYAEYGSVIVVSKDSKITKLEELVGKRIALQDRDSTSGFMLPADIMLSEGLALVEQKRPQTEPEAGAVNYYFTGNDHHSVTWLLKGWVDAIGTDTPTFDMLEAAKPGAFRVLASSLKVPRHVVLMSNRLPPDVRKAVITVLKEMNRTDRGRGILEGFSRTTKFDAFPMGEDVTFGPIYETLVRLEKHTLF